MPAAPMRFAISGLLVILLLACSQESRSNLTVSPDVFASGWIEAWHSHDVERILSYYTDDAFYAPAKEAVF